MSVYSVIVHYVCVVVRLEFDWFRIWSDDLLFETVSTVQLMSLIVIIWASIACADINTVVAR